MLPETLDGPTAGAPGNHGPAVAHLVIPFAACASEAWWPSVTQLPPAATTHLRALLAGMQPIASDQTDLRSLTPPHERLLARLLDGQPPPDGLPGWAARHLWQTTGQPPQAACGFVSLCHWAMGREHATLSDPQALALSEQESRTLLAAMQPLFEEDGIALHYLAPERWLAQGAALAVPTASLDRVLGRNVDPWLPSTQAARTLRRLQNEMQMLLYTHPVNAEREQRRALSVNSLWFSGTGPLPPSAAPGSRRPGTPPAAPAIAARAPLPPGNASAAGVPPGNAGAAGVLPGNAGAAGVPPGNAGAAAPPPGNAGATGLTLSRALAAPALAEDWAGYAQAWQALDAGELAELQQRQRAGERVRLSLCGERGSLTLETAPRNLRTRLLAWRRRPAWPHLLQDL